MKFSVIIDGRKLGDGGIGTYIENLLDGLIEITPELDFELELSMLLQKPTRSCASDATSRIESALCRWNNKINLLFDSSSKYSIDEHFVMPLRHARSLRQASVFHSPHYTLPYFLGVPSVVTIHDVLHVTRPENPYQKVIGKRLITSACRRASKIITVSQRSYQELLKVSEGISGDAIVIPNALSRDVVVPTAEQLIETRNKLNTDSRYFLFVGSDRPHKGLKLLLDSYKLAKEVALTESMPKVVLVGERYGRWVNEYLSQLGIEADVQLLGAVSTERLNCLYLGAEAVLLPSLDEGFGLVALEAMSLGAPVICFPLEVLREISNSFWFAENCNAESFSQMILKVMSSPDLVKARALLAREDTSKFSIKNVASKTLHVYLSCQVDSEGRKRNEIDDTIDAHLTDTVH